MALHAELPVRIMRFGQSRHYHLCWDEIPQLERGWKKPWRIYPPRLPESYALGRSLAGAQGGDQADRGLNKWHTPSICTAWCSKGTVLLAILSFKQIPKDDRTLMMKAVSSVVLADLQFHQLNSACWDSTKLSIGYGRHRKSQLKLWAQPVLLTSVFPVTADFIRHWTYQCWHPTRTPVPGPGKDCLDAKGTEEVLVRKPIDSTMSLGNASI